MHYKAYDELKYKTKTLVMNMQRVIFLVKLTALWLLKEYPI